VVVIVERPVVIACDGTLIGMSVVAVGVLGTVIVVDSIVVVLRCVVVIHSRYSDYDNIVGI